MFRLRYILSLLAIVLLGLSLYPMVRGHSDYSSVVIFTPLISLAMLVLAFLPPLGPNEAGGQAYLDFIKSQRHDFLNYVQVLQGYCQLGKFQMINGYLAEIIEDLKVTSTLISLPPDICQVFLSNIYRAKKIGINLAINIDTAVNLPSSSTQLLGLFRDLFSFVFYKSGETATGRIDLVLAPYNFDGLMVSASFPTRGAVSVWRLFLHQRALGRRVSQLKGRVEYITENNRGKVKVVITNK